MLNFKICLVRVRSVILASGFCAVFSVHPGIAADAPAVAVVAEVAPLAVAPPVAVLPVVPGSYDVVGINAVDKTSYAGVVLVSKKGEAYLVKYQDSDEKSTGIASQLGNVLAVAYADDNKATICLMEPDGMAGFRGQCVEQGEDLLYREDWKRR